MIADMENMHSHKSACDVSIIIVNYNSTQLLINCVRTIVQHTKNVEYEIIVVDNASPDNGKDLLKKEIGTYIHLIESERNLGFGGANNIGIKVARGKYLFFLNPDTILLNNAVKIFFDYAEEKDYSTLGALGGVLMDVNKKPTDSYDYFLSPRKIYNDAMPKGLCRAIEKKFISAPIDVDFITGAAMFSPSENIRKVGGFDEGFFMYCEEVDLQRRMADIGLKRIAIPGPEIIHLEGSSYAKNKGRSARRRLEHDRSKCYYIKKHYSRVKYIMFRITFFFVRQPAVFNPRYTVKENLSYLKMLVS